MTTKNLDDSRQDVLDNMERQQRVMKLALIGAALFEALLLTAALLLVDWHDRTQKLVLVMSLLSYSIIALGLIALGAHTSRMTSRVLAAIDPGNLR